MSHQKDMLSRLPLLYREGELVASVLGVPGLQLAILDEEGLEVRRAHWFDSALELEEAARLAAILDIPPESWQHLAQYRVWGHALRNAMLDSGAVTKSALQNFVMEYTRRFQDVTGITTITQFDAWADSPSTRDPAFIETPPLRRQARAPDRGGIEPLYQFSLVQKGLDKTYVDFLLLGLPDGPESVPVIVNLTTQEALFFLGSIAPGQRLWITALPDGGVRAWLENHEVTDQMRSVTSVTPGTPWAQAQVSSPAKAISLVQGQNDLWFLPLAHYDALGLDRFLLALADLALTQGRFDQTNFDRSVFYQEPAVQFYFSWIETQPAAFRVELPAGSLLNRDGDFDDAVQSRVQLGASLDLAIKKLKAAGVQGCVVMQPFIEMQPQTDYLTGVLPVEFREGGTVGADTLPNAGGVFDVTQFGDSTFR